MSFLSTLLQHPRRLWLRRALFQIHLWSGVLIAVYLILIALSGSVLVYKDELVRWSLPKALTPLQPSQQATADAILEHFRQSRPGATVSSLQFPSAVLPAFLLEGKDTQNHATRWIADPVTGALFDAPRNWLDTVHDLHYYLLLPPSQGLQINAVGAAILLGLAVTGLALWWPGVRLWTRGLRVNVRAHWRRLNFDLHNAVGFWTLAIVTWWAISGVYFGFYKQVTAVVNWASPLQGMRSPPAAALPLATSASRASLNEVLAAARAASPGGALWSVSDPQGRTPESYVLLDRAAAGDFSHRDIVRVRSADAHVLSVWHYGERHSAGDWFLWLMHPLHFGTVWGEAVKFIWAMLGISLVVLTVTGLLMYWNRFLRHMFR